MDKVDNREIECMVCASCTFKGRKRQEGRKIDRDGEERCGLVSKREKMKLSKNCEEQSHVGACNSGGYVQKFRLPISEKTAEKVFSKRSENKTAMILVKLIGDITVKTAIGEKIPQ